MNKIDAHARSVNELLKDKKYSIDYYQREYKWETRQINELLEDLEAKFFESYEEGHDYQQVRFYKHYFLGSIIVSDHNVQRFIIDGQQRLTSLTLLLIFLQNLQREQVDVYKVQVQDLIFSDEFGKQSFNIDVAEREECLRALLNDQPCDPDSHSESVRNIVARYEDIKAKFPQTLRGNVLPYFIFWLKSNVDLIEITTYSDEEAYNIFETMNDRGLSLSPTDMLKGYLLANIVGSKERTQAESLWKSRLFELSQFGKEEDADFFKAWLRAKYADTIREGKKGAVNKDFEKIGTFHKWVREERERIGLRTNSDFRNFVMHEFKTFSGHYMRVLEAARHMTPGLEYIYYNAHNNFTLQYPLVLAPLRSSDDLDTADRKIRLVAGYLDIFIARRAVNFRTLDYSSVVYTMFNLMKGIRGLDVPELVAVLKEKVATMAERFDGMKHFRLNLWSKRYVHHILARITSHIEEQSDVTPKFFDYIARGGKNPFEIEHIWADHYDQHKDEFASEFDFDIYRSRIGNLILLRSDINRGIGDDPYEKKLEVYRGQNVLAQSLEEQFYHNNHRFLTYKERSGLPFQPHPSFKKSDIDARQELYRLICEEIWSPSRFDRELN